VLLTNCVGRRLCEVMVCPFECRDPGDLFMGRLSVNTCSSPLLFLVHDNNVPEAPRLGVQCRNFPDQHATTEPLPARPFSSDVKNILIIANYSFKSPSLNNRMSQHSITLSISPVPFSSSASIISDFTHQLTPHHSPIHILTPETANAGRLM